jgi:hypothetical protein
MMTMEELVAVQAAEAERQAILDGSFKTIPSIFDHMMDKKEQKRLDLLWAQALHHAGIPPNVIEDDYVRCAIYETSKIKVCFWFLFCCSSRVIVVLQGRYVAPRRRQLGGPLLHTICNELSASVQAELLVANCRTLQLDGWDKGVEQLVNAVVTSEGSEEFLGDHNATGKSKDATATAALMVSFLKQTEKRYPPAEPGDVVVDAIVTDNPSVNQAARPKVRAQWPKRIFLYGCWLHGLSKLIDDVLKLPFFKSLIVNHKMLVRKIRKKHWLHASLLRAQMTDRLSPHFVDKLGRFQPLTVKRMGETRMGSAYPMMKRTVKLAPALLHVAADPQFDTKCGISKKAAAVAEAAISLEVESEMESASDSDADQPELSAEAKKQADYLEVKALMKSEEFQAETAEAITLLRPLMKALRVADRRDSQHGVVWDSMAKLDTHYKELIATHDGSIPSEQLEQLHQCVIDRWEYLHDPTHSAAYALNPHFHSVDCMLDESVKTDLEAVIADFYPDINDQVKCLVEFHYFKSKSIDAWKSQIVWMQAKFLSPAAFWTMHGGCSPLLRPVALCVLQLNHAAGGCERNWSTHDFLYGKRRHSTSSNTLSREVYYYTNSRMYDTRVARGKKKLSKKRKHCTLNGEDLEYPEWADCYSSGNESV